MTLPRDILDDFDRQRKRPSAPTVDVRIGMVVEDRSSGFCGDVVKMTSEAVTLRGRGGVHRHFRWKEAGFLLDGQPVTLRRPSGHRERGPVVTASGSLRAPGQVQARVARGSRIWVEGRHDAELLEHVWGDDLRDLGIVVEPLHGADDLAVAVAEFDPGPGHRLGVLLDHLVEGSKESRLATAVRHPHVLVTGHPFVDVWEGIRPGVLGLEAWPAVPRGVPWKEGLCRALGTELDGFWPRLRNQVRTYADLRPELVGAVERLVDFVADETLDADLSV
jgi:hypothetical protein